MGGFYAHVVDWVGDGGGGFEVDGIGSDWLG